MLDEWVVGLVRYNPAGENDSLCWESTPSTLQTLADAATRVRSFAYRDEELVPTTIDSDGVMRLDLQGVDYTVAVVHRSPVSVGEFEKDASKWLSDALASAPDEEKGLNEDGVRMGAVLVTPQSLQAGQSTDDFVNASRRVPSSACAFSFPDPHEMGRYHHTNSEYPGVILLLIRPKPKTSRFWLEEN